MKVLARPTYIAEQLCGQMKEKIFSANTSIKFLLV